MYVYIYIHKHTQMNKKQTIKQQKTTSYKRKQSTMWKYHKGRNPTKQKTETDT